VPQFAVSPIAAQALGAAGQDAQDERLNDCFLVCRGSLRTGLSNHERTCDAASLPSSESALRFSPALEQGLFLSLPS